MANYKLETTEKNLSPHVSVDRVIEQIVQASPYILMRQVHEADDDAHDYKVEKNHENDQKRR